MTPTLMAVLLLICCVLVLVGCGLMVYGLLHTEQCNDWQYRVIWPRTGTWSSTVPPYERRYFDDLGPAQTEARKHSGAVIERSRRGPWQRVES